MSATPPNSPVHVELLGAFRVWVDGRVVADSAFRLRKARTLLKLLLLAADHRLHREQALNLLWPELSPEAGGNQLRKALHAARQALGAAAEQLHYDGEQIALEGECTTDIAAFEAAVATARNRQEAEAYQRAIDGFGGELLPGDRYEDWAVAARERLHELFIETAAELARLYETRGQPERAVETLRLVTAAEPAHEEAHVRLMRLHALAGRRHQALRVYAQLREGTAHELGIEPGLEARRLREELLSGRYPAVAPATPPEVARAREALPLVGRAAVWDDLEDRLEALLEGDGGVLVVRGEAGAGKSRLAAELARHAYERGATVLWGSARASAGDHAYRPFAAALDGFAHLASQPARDQLFSAVAARLGAHGERAPTVLVLDDLESADAASFDLLLYLARGVADRRSLIVALVRSDVEPTDTLRDALETLERDRLAARIELPRLDRDEGALLVRARLGSEPVDGGVCEAVFELAAGNPLYTEHVVAALLAGGGVRLVDGRWRLAARRPALPAALDALLVARLEGLGGRARAVLEAIAVAGEASYPLLRSVIEAPDDELLEALDECLRSPLVIEAPRSFSLDHPLHRALVYDRIASERRRDLHARIAEQLEAEAGEQAGDGAEALAHHWLASERPDRALPYLIAAAERAAGVFANELALAHYRRALALLPHDAPDRPAVFERIGDLANLAGLADVEIEAYAAAVNAASAPSEARQRLHRKLASAHLMRHLPAAAAPHLETATTLAPLADTAEQARLAGVRANLLWEQGHIDEAVAAAADALDQSERHGTPADVATASQQLAIALHFKGEWRHGLHLEIERLGTASDHAGLGNVFDLHHCMGQYYLYGATPLDEVEHYARGTLDLAERTQVRRAQAFAWCLLGETLLLAGRWDEAGPCLERSAELHAQQGTRSGGLAWQRLAELASYRGASAVAEQHLQRGMLIATVSPLALHLWGRLYATRALDALERGDAAEAVHAVEAADAAAARYGQCPSCYSLLHPVAAEAYAHLDAPERAAVHAQRARDVAALQPSPGWSAMAATAAAWAARARGDEAEAGHQFLTAAGFYQESGQPFWTGRTLLQLAAVGGEHARAHLERANILFERLGATRARGRALEALREA